MIDPNHKSWEFNVLAQQRFKISSKTFCIYTHSHGGKVVYVGKGRAHRPFDFQFRSLAWSDFFSDKDIEVCIVEWFENEKAALLKEKQLIKKLKPVLNQVHNEDWAEKKKEPKSRNFSVSFRVGEIEKIHRHVDQLSAATGFRITKNQFIRKATLAVMEYQRLVLSGEWENVSIDEIFKGIE